MRYQKREPPRSGPFQHFVIRRDCHNAPKHWQPTAKLQNSPRGTRLRTLRSPHSPLSTLPLRTPPLGILLMSDTSFAFRPELARWLGEAAEGTLSWSELAERLLQFEHAPGSEHRPDLDRRRRCGFGEVIFGAGKSPAAIARIAHTLLADSPLDEVLVTRVDRDQLARLGSEFAHLRYDSLGRTLRVADRPIAEVQLPSPTPSSQRSGMVERVVVVTAGSTDLPVAREALETLRWMGVAAELVTDVGVAGPYRLLPHLERLRTACALVVVAGMEGALASVVGGLVPCPIIAVPTSVGYGANLGGMTTLLSMLSSCAAGVTVVNIDAGFKGGYVAGLIARPRS